jgi:hypothetical protein
MQNKGNVWASEVYEHNLPAGTKPQPSTADAVVERFARAKYEEKRWYKKPAAHHHARKVTAVALACAFTDCFARSAVVAFQAAAAEVASTPTQQQQKVAQQQQQAPVSNSANLFDLATNGPSTSVMSDLDKLLAAAPVAQAASDDFGAFTAVRTRTYTNTHAHIPFCFLHFN